MKRREALKVTAGAALLPSLLSAQAAQAKGWKPLLFTPQQDAAVVALTEIIIPATDTPGARQAGVNRYIDLLLHDGPAAEGERFLAGLQWLDEYAVSKNGKPFAKLTTAEQAA
ncbi:MAG: gluconate 2-dehydrogenase subunit 3 family protein, partial [Bryobacteraceae bacterium]